VFGKDGLLPPALAGVTITRGLRSLAFGEKSDGVNGALRAALAMTGRRGLVAVGEKTMGYAPRFARDANPSYDA